MKILKNNKLEDFKTIYNNNGKISFTQGKNIDISKNAAYVVPGFIDQHIHGAMGYDIMDNTHKSIIEISKVITSEGTTSFLPTTMTYDLDTLKEVIQKVYETMEKDKSVANIIGVHLEGPFLEKDYIGAQNPKYIEIPKIEYLNKIDPNGCVKLITYAVEHDKDFEFTKELKKRKINASVGHSGATCDCVLEAIKNGVNNFTHFHNAMSKHDHRTPGVVTAGLIDKTNAKKELIVDGIHVHPVVVKSVYEIQGNENIVLITDAMRAKAMKDGEYELGGQKVIKKGQEARLANGTLAGSVLCMNIAVKNYYNFTNCKLEEAFKAASYNVAKHYELKTKGMITDGYDFDITVLDENFNVLQTFIKGIEVYKK